MNKALHILTIFCFLFIELLPFSARLSGIDSKIDFIDNRSPLLPDLRGRSLLQIPEDLTNYYRSNYGFYSLLLLMTRQMKFSYLKIHVTNDEIIGKDGWLFNNHFDVNKPTRNYETVFFSVEELKKIKEELEHEQSQFKLRSTPYFLVVISDKEVIYPEYYPFPDNILTELRLNQLIDYLDKNSDFRLIDLRPALLAKKSIEQLYYQNDPHWNDAGAFYGYQEIMRKLSEVNFKTYIPQRVDFESRPPISSVINSGTSWANLFINPIHLKTRFTPTNNFPGESKKLNKVIIYGDSFSKSIIEGQLTGLSYFLGFSFKNVHSEDYITDKERSENAFSPLDYDLIDLEKPDLVIRETAEYNLRILLGPKYSSI